jgi:hypothetical protein
VLLGESAESIAIRSPGVGVRPFEVGETELSRLSIDDRCDGWKKDGLDGGGSCFPPPEESGEGE